MKVNIYNTHYISVVLFLIIHARIFTSSKLNLQKNLSSEIKTPKINKESPYENPSEILKEEQNQTLKINPISKEKNELRSISDKENSIMSIKIDKIEKALSNFYKNLNLNKNKFQQEFLSYKITPILKLKKDLNNFSNKANSTKENQNENEKEKVSNKNFNLNKLKIKTDENTTEKKQKPTNKLNDVEINNDNNNNSNKNKLNESDNLVMDYFQKINIDEFMGLNYNDNDKNNNNEYYNLDIYRSFILKNNLIFVLFSIIVGGLLGLLFVLFFSYRDNYFIITK
jgi:hypothetical protein